MPEKVLEKHKESSMEFKTRIDIALARAGECTTPYAKLENKLDILLNGLVGHCWYLHATSLTIKTYRAITNSGLDKGVMLYR